VSHSSVLGTLVLSPVEGQHPALPSLTQHSVLSTQHFLISPPTPPFGGAHVRYCSFVCLMPRFGPVFDRGPLTLALSHWRGEGRERGNWQRAERRGVRCQRRGSRREGRGACPPKPRRRRAKRNRMRRAKREAKNSSPLALREIEIWHAMDAMHAMGARTP
jgi:hypothetical protein